MRKRKQILFNIALLACTVFVSLTAAEVFLRVTTSRPEMRVGTTRTPKAKFYGWAPIPNYTSTFVDFDNGKKHTVQINSQGWKDVEHAFAKPKGIVRILFLGDSYTFGMVPLEDLYTRRVQQKLIARGVTNIEVISMGVGSWGTDQELEALKLEGIRYHPDVVIYQFCHNDIENNMQPREGMVVNEINKIYLRKPFRYVLREGRLAKIKIQTTMTTHPPVDRRLKDLLLKSEIIYRLNLIWGRIQSRFTAARTSKVRKVYVGKDKEPQKPEPWWTRHRIKPDGVYKPDDGTPHRLSEWNLFEALILEMRSVASRVGAEFVIFSEAGEEGQRLWNLRQGRIQNDGGSDYVMWGGEKHTVDTKRPLKDLSKICRRHSIPLIKPVRTYERYHNNPHTNAKGNDMMAEDIIDFLLSWDHFRRLVTLFPDAPPRVLRAEQPDAGDKQ